MQKYIAAIEIGSSMIKGAVGVYDSSSDTVLVLASEQVPVSGCVRYGWVNNVEEVRTHLEDVVRALEKAPGVKPHKIDSVYVALDGRSLNSSSREVSLRLNDEQKITSDTLAQLRRDARDSFFTDKEIIEVSPRQFSTDTGLIANPIGAYSRSISAIYNIVTCRPQLKRNILRVFDEIEPRISIAGFIVLPLAEAQLVMSKDECRLGCMVVDFGAETTSVAVYKDGNLRYLATLPLGSKNITNDLTTLGVTEEKAEDYKKAHGNAMPEYSFSSSAVEGDSLSPDIAGNIISARAGEIAANIIAQISYAGLRNSDLLSGIILTGGGSRLRNFGRLIQEESGLKVRQGIPSQAVNMADGSTRQSSEIDILATLLAAARTADVKECLTMPAPVRPETPVKEEAPAPRNTYTAPHTYVIDNTDDNDDKLLADDDDSDYTPQEQEEEQESFFSRRQKKSRRRQDEKPSMISKLQAKFADLIKGPDEDDDL